MNEKINITIDANKIPKDRVVERRYMDRNNYEVSAREIKLELVPSKEPRKISEGPTWELWKTHFIVIAATKEERAAKTKTPIVGEGLMFKDKKVADAEDILEQGDITPDDIPAF